MLEKHGQKDKFFRRQKFAFLHIKATKIHRISEELVNKVIEYCKNKNGYEDILELCESVLESSYKVQNSDKLSPTCIVGEVYLFKSGRYYKIGKTSDTVLS